MPKHKPERNKCQACGDPIKIGDFNNITVIFHDKAGNSEVVHQTMDGRCFGNKKGRIKNIMGGM